MVELISIILLTIFAISTTNKPYPLPINICLHPHAHRALSKTLSRRGKRNSLPVRFSIDTVKNLVNRPNLWPLLSNPSASTSRDPSEPLPSNPSHNPSEHYLEVLIDSTNKPRLPLSSNPSARLPNNFSSPFRKPSDSTLSVQPCKPPSCYLGITPTSRSVLLWSTSSDSPSNLPSSGRTSSVLSDLGESPLRDQVTVPS